MVRLAARAAAIRGDNLQHSIGLFTLAEALRDPDAESISIEDPDGGAFDDVVLRRRAGRSGVWRQVKSSNYGGEVVDDEWLTKKKTRKGKSPLQAFFATWRDLRDGEEEFALELITNRNFDHHSPFFKVLDKKLDRVPRESLEPHVGRSTDLGKLLKTWAAHVDAELDELLDCLSSVVWRNEGSDLSWRRRTGDKLELGGFRGDEEAVRIGMNMVSDWVTDGVRSRTIDEARADLEELNLLARTGTLLLAVNGIDEEATKEPANALVDYTDLYEESDPAARRQIRSNADWNDVVLPRIRDAVRKLEGFKSRRAHVTGSMRLPTWFAVGRTMPGVRRWILSLEQEGVEWLTDARDGTAGVEVLADLPLEHGDDLAVCIALRHDPTADVNAYLLAAGISAGRVLTVGGDRGVGPHAAADGPWTANWVAQVQDLLLAKVKEFGSQRIHLFIAGPAGAALMLGHRWNVLPATTVYEHVPGTGYAPTFDFPA